MKQGEKNRKKRRNEDGNKNIDIWTSIPGRHVTATCVSVFTPKKTKQKYPIDKGEKYDKKERKKQKEKTAKEK